MNKLVAFLLILFTGLAVSPLQAAEVSGKIGYMSGVLVTQRPDGTIKVMAPKSEVFEGDLLVTAKDSYAQVLMNDGTTMTLRPNTNLRIESYHFNQNEPKNDNEVLRLLKGGLRTLSGWISKRGNSDAYQMHVATATLGIRGTDFSTRLCATKNCRDDEEVAQPVKPPVAQARTVGRVVQLQGELVVKEAGGKERKMVLDSPVYEGDTLQSGASSYAIVVFRDGGRVTLQAGSVFKIEQFKYQETAVQDSVIMRLLKGGVRSLTGLIGQINHNNFQFHVATATLGIRGTGFDAWCNGPCAEGANDSGATTGKPLEGAGVFVWAGEVLLSGPGGSIPLGLNQAAIIERGTGGKPVLLLTIPPDIINNTAPKPDTIPVNVDKLFKEESSSVGEPGVYVTVHDGLIALSQGGAKLDIGYGETGFANGIILIRLVVTPSFMGGDEQLNLMNHGGKNANGCVVGQ